MNNVKSNGVCTNDASFAQQEAERLWLCAFYLSTHGDQWLHNGSWTTDATIPVAEWYGITIEAGMVTAIQLPENRLKGVSEYNYCALILLQ